MRLDSRLQECQEAHWKRSFPDLDYAFFGYDVLKGYPLASGHDPGFTHPIFLSKYSSSKQTSDCRYSVPEGLIVVPDVSCVTSFSSKVIRNKVEMSSSLSAAANVEGASPSKCSLPGQAKSSPRTQTYFPLSLGSAEATATSDKATAGNTSNCLTAPTLILEPFLDKNRVILNLDNRHREA